MTLMTEIQRKLYHLIEFPNLVFQLKLMFSGPFFWLEYKIAGLVMQVFLLAQVGMLFTCRPSST